MNHGTVSAAARFLGVSQPGVSRLLLNLEESMSVRLFNRVNGRLEPTRAAHMLHEEVEGAFVGVERVRSLMMRLSDLQAGLVRVVAAHTLAHTLVLDRLALLRRERPNLQLVIDYATANEMGKELEAGKFDIGVAIAERPLPGLQYRRVTTFQFVLAVPKGHRLASRTSVGAQDLVGEPMITYRRNSPVFVSLARRGLAPVLDAARIEAGSALIACGAVEHGLGIAIVSSETLMQQEFRNVVAVPLETRIDLPVLAYYRRETLNSAITKAALDVLCSGAAQRPPAPVHRADPAQGPRARRRR